jgi:hypothetical protein
VTENAMKWRSYENNFQEYKTDLPDKTIQWAQSKGWGFRGKIRQKHLDLERAKILDSQLLLFKFYFYLQLVLFT